MEHGGGSQEGGREYFELLEEKVWAEDELKKARNFNRAAVSLIILLLCFMVSMLLCIKRQEESFRCLETRYEELREELIGTDYGE